MEEIGDGRAVGGSSWGSLPSEIANLLSFGAFQLSHC
jgi:hypothetical protein